MSKKESVLSRNKKILEKMHKNRIFNIEIDKNEFFITEGCDEYFSYHITKSDAVELAELFKSIALLEI